MWTPYLGPVYETLVVDKGPQLDLGPRVDLFTDNDV